MSKKKLNCFITPTSLCIISVCALLIFSSTASNALAAAVPRQNKKVIEYGWDWLYLDQLANPSYIKKIEKLPFDGVCFRISKQRVRGFSLKPWTDKEFPAKKLKSIKWNKFTDNFISFWPASNSKKFNWYDDSQWEIIQNNVRQYSRAVKLSGSVGIFFDPEATYGNSFLGKWKYNKEKFGDKSYEQVSQELRKRGSQFIKALQSHKPDIKILSFIMWNQLIYTKRALNAPPEKQDKALEHKYIHYSLWLPFIEGMMKSAGPKVQIIDGHEWGYYDIAAKSYKKGYADAWRNYLSLVPKALRNKMAGQMQIGMPIYVDQVLALRVPTTWAPPVSQHLPMKKRVKLFGYQLYHAMATSDKYVWVYSERMKWWPGYTDWKHMMTARGLGKDITNWDEPQISEGLVKTMRTTIQRYKSSKPCLYNGEKLLAEAKANKKSKMKNSN